LFLGPSAKSRYCCRHCATKNNKTPNNTKAKKNEEAELYPPPKKKSREININNEAASLTAGDFTPTKRGPFCDSLFKSISNGKR
jgi:hypothetical protein